MANTMNILSSFVVGLMVLALIRGNVEAMEFTCHNIFQYKLMPCSLFLLGEVPSPDNKCCAEVRNLDDMANASEANRKVICECIKGALDDKPDRFPINFHMYQQLDDICQVPNYTCRGFSA